MERTQNSRLKHMTFNCDLDLESAWLSYGFCTSSLSEANIQPKFNENPSRGKGGMEWTRNSRLKLLTFNCDFDLESAWLSNGSVYRLTEANICSV